ncbi:MAG TPA: DUF4349 domain-containing protein [Egicoccus sp.]|nr:DUF4349 domain-containing protein [Egicoccus sp.]HSK25088.1 DUF4349 domain-containing protein [Egicoccus sp.]
MRTTTWARARGITAAGLAAALLLGCSGGADEAATADSGGVEMEAEAPQAVEEAEGEGSAADADTGGGDGASALPVAATLGRRVIRTATVELQDADPGAVADEVTRVVERAGGFVATADLRRDDDGVLSGSVTVRVPSERLEATLDELEALADNAPLRRIEETDVTVESADLGAQLRNLEAFETELRALLTEVEASSPDAEDLLRVYERIREVRGEIDRINGRLDVLDDQVSLATITVRLTPTVAAVPVADEGWAPGDTVRAALSAGVRALTAVADAAIWVGLAVLPVLLVLGLPVAAAWLVWRRRTTAPPTPSA